MPRHARTAVETISLLTTILDRGRRRARVAALALADAQGLLIAGAGRHAWCELIGARAPLDSRVGFREPIDLGGQHVYLCASDFVSDRALLGDIVNECRDALAPRVRWVA
jgi:hypothetical protein